LGVDIPFVFESLFRSTSAAHGFAGKKPEELRRENGDERSLNEASTLSLSLRAAEVTNSAFNM